MKRPKNPSFDVQFGLELNRAIASGNGDAAAAAFAEIVRSAKLVISKEAWAFLGDAVREQGGGANNGEHNGDVKETSDQ